MDQQCPKPEPHEQHLWTPPGQPPGLERAHICLGEGKK